VKKIKLLFVIESLCAAGAEKSLVALLNELDFKRYEVDLQLFSHGGTFEKYLPKQVNLLKPLNYFDDCKKTLLKHVTSPKGLHFLWVRYKYSVLLRLKKRNNLNQAKLLWNCADSLIKPPQTKIYNVAIAYAQGLPTYYVADSIKAKDKIAWVNVSLSSIHVSGGFQEQMYNNFNKIVIVSRASYEIFINTFASLTPKASIIYDINSEKLTNKILSSELDMTFIDDNKLSLLTVGRLNHQKGYDFAIDAAVKLKRVGISFNWYFMGAGSLYDELNHLIIQNDLVDNVHLIGVKNNPLAIMNDVDIYVQPSRFEGFGLALFEARMIGKPCIATNFETASLQISHDVNGQVVAMEGTQIADAIVRYLDDPEYTQNIVNEQAKCKFFNTEEVKKFDAIIEGFKL
jgi:glycosyltransferase involved in cell wall biosynthesis